MWNISLPVSSAIKYRLCLSFSGFSYWFVVFRGQEYRARLLNIWTNGQKSKKYKKTTRIYCKNFEKQKYFLLKPGGGGENCSGLRIEPCQR
jgi:hypothetical protein